MGIRMSGLVSGLDTESIISELMSAQSSKKKKLEGDKTKLEWKQDIWSDLNKQIYSLYTDKISKLRTEGQYAVKAITSTDESKATATAAAGAVNGNYSLKVKQLSSSQSWTGGKLAAGTTENSALTELGISAGTVFRIQSGASDKASGKYTTFEVTEESTLSDFMAACKKAGISSNYDSNLNRLFVGSSDSGADNGFELTAYAGDSDYTVALDSLKDTLEFDSRTEKEQKNILNAVGVLTKYSDEEISDKLMNEEWTQEEYDAYLENQDLAMEYLESFGGTSSGLQAIVDDIYESKNTGSSSDALTALKLTEDSGATQIAAKDSVIEYNGAEFTSATNDFKINNVKIKVKDVTGDEKITLNVANDTESIYTMLKDFCKSYNELIENMSTMYTAKVAKGYEPLTEEEKKAMSDSQVELCEEKIKKSLLRRDEAVDGLMASMRSSLATSVKVDGKSYSLATFGISTSDDYTEYGKLHIYGDEDDSDFSQKEKKLKNGLENDPETVAKVVSGIMQNLYTTLNKKMEATTLSSAMSFYNDKEATKQVKSYEDDIKTWTTKLKDMEDRYYSQFSTMEKSLSTLKSQSSYLTNMTG